MVKFCSNLVLFASTFKKINISLLKFIYSEKATKFGKISTIDLYYVVRFKSTVEMSQNFVAFSENMNFISHSNSFFELPPGLGCMTFFVVK